MHAATFLMVALCATPPLAAGGSPRRCAPTSTPCNASLRCCSAADLCVGICKTWRPPFPKLLTPAPAVGPSGPARTLNLTVVLLRGSGWTPEQAREHLAKTERIYAACGIRLGRSEVREADPEGPVDVDWQSCGTGILEQGIRGRDLALAEALPPSTPRPVVFLVRSNVHNGSSAYACPRFAVGSRSPLLDTAWITAKVHSRSYEEIVDRVDPDYDPIAHELAHLLGNRGHNSDSEPNLLHDDLDKRTSALLPEQCAAFSRSPLLGP